MLGRKVPPDGLRVRGRARADDVIEALLTDGPQAVDVMAEDIAIEQAAGHLDADNRPLGHHLDLAEHVEREGARNAQQADSLLRGDGAHLVPVRVQLGLREKGRVVGRGNGGLACVRE